MSRAHQVTKSLKNKLLTKKT